MRYYIITFGCQMNRSDSERIATVLELAGLSPAADINNADLLIINSCSVRQSAINRIFGLLNNLKKNRRKNKTRDIKTILTGCILNADKKKLADKFDLIIDIKELTQKPKNLINFLRLQDQEFKAFDYTDYFKINPQYRSKFSAYIPIMTGCNNFCAYCAVPYTRGREVSRPAEEIINEIKKLVEKGYKEITLLGQNVNSYKSEVKNPPQPPFFKGGEKKEEKNSPFAKACPEFISGGVRGISVKTKIETINFPKLLKLIDNIPGEFWIRFLTSHPKDMSDKLIKTMVKCEKVTEYVHLPIQSGDDEILNKMNRHYTEQQYLELIEKIKQAYKKRNSIYSRRHSEQSEESLANARNRTYVRDSSVASLPQNYNIWQPPVAISTDIIVGFPGETKKQFQNTAKIMRHVKFDMAYLSEYSPRTGTVAAKMPDTVSIAEKKQRKEFLNEILRKTALANNKKYVGKIVDVLIEKTDADFAYGKTQTFKNVKIATKPFLECHPELVSGSVKLNKKKMLKQVQHDNLIIHPGQFARIKITQAGAWGLEGKIA